MAELHYHIEKFDGPLDLLLTLIHKNKFSIEDIPISIICEQYFEYLTQAKQLDMEIAAEFIVMASELMLIKSKMLLPKVKEDEEDPRAMLADALIKYAKAKEAAKKMALLYPIFSARMEKDTDEISVDKTFVAEQSIEKIILATRRILAYNENRPEAQDAIFKPMISKPIVPVEAKIVDIVDNIKTKKSRSLKQLLDVAVSLPDMIAIFLGVLELIKVQQILIVQDEHVPSCVFDNDTLFIINEDFENQN